MNTPQQIALGGAVLLVLWYCRDWLWSLVPSMKSKPSRIEAVKSLEDAERISIALGVPDAAKCCRHAAQALFADEIKHDSHG